MSGPTESRDMYENAKAERQKCVDAILSSTAAKKVVVAGPGTGKTLLFKEILKGKKNALALTFVTSLVEDLTLDLLGLAEVRTLHGYALKVVRSVNQEMQIFPKLSRVIREDALVLLEQDVDFDSIFANRDDSNELIKFYRKRKLYYGDWYGFTDVIFAAVKKLGESLETIPEYDLVVVDEFQDFNKLEVSLIDILARISPILLVGDDDQALYPFKDASAEHIRHRYDEANPEYASFVLPFCSRCTSTIVDAANDLIRTSKKRGYLRDRIPKPFKYFPSPEKDRDSDRHPCIVYTRKHVKQFPEFIKRQLDKTVDKALGEFSVLIISPTNEQVRAIVSALNQKGLTNIKTKKRHDGNETTLLDGLCRLLEDGRSNLGWRIVAKALMEAGDFEALLKESNAENAAPIIDLIDSKLKKDAKRPLTLIRKVKKNKNATISAEELDEVLNDIGLDPLAIRTSALSEEVSRNSPKPRPHALNMIPIQATTIARAKGLAADYVFLTHFNDEFLISDRDNKTVSDLDICSFLVALTRARRQVILLSCETLPEPSFISWIDKARIETVNWPA